MKEDKRKFNGGHRNGGKKPLGQAKKKLWVMISLSPEEFEGDWKPSICEQFERKFKNKLKSICNSN